MNENEWGALGFQIFVVHIMAEKVFSTADLQQTHKDKFDVGAFVSSNISKTCAITIDINR